MAIANNPLGIYDKSLWCAVDSQINTQLALIIDNINFKRVIVPNQLVARIHRIVIIVDTIKRHPLFSTNTHEFRMFHKTVRAPGSPDIY